MSTKPTAPAYLSPKSKAWFNTIASDYELESHHLRLLEAACLSWDRSEEARKRIEKDGAYLVNDKGILKNHPALKDELAYRTLFIRTIREMGLDNPAPATRPPR